MTHRHAAAALACVASVLFVTSASAAAWSAPEFADESLLQSIHAGSAAGGWSPQEIAEESVFQAIHLVDLEQTLDIHRHGNLEEMGFSDGGCAWAIGHYPSEPRIYAYMSAEAAAHLLVTEVLVRFGKPWMVHTFERATISFNAMVIDNNARLGLTVRF